MNDFDYDVAQKKRIARGAYHKKGGSRSKKCTLPGDYLTPAEKKKLSTTLVDVNLKKPMSYEQFKALPTDVKREYLTFLRDECGGTLQTVVEMLDVSRQSYCSYIRRDEPTLKGIFPKGRSSIEAIEEREKKWTQWLNQGAEAERTVWCKTYTPRKETPAEPDDFDEEDDDSPEEKTPPITTICEMSFRMVGLNSVQDICDAVRKYIGDREVDYCAVTVGLR